MYCHECWASVKIKDDILKLQFLSLCRSGLQSGLIQADCSNFTARLAGDAWTLTEVSYSCCTISWYRSMLLSGEVKGFGQ